MVDVSANMDKPWIWHYLSWNPNITMADVLAHPDKPWDWEYLIQNRATLEPTLDELQQIVRKWYAGKVIVRAIFKMRGLIQNIQCVITGL